MTETSKKWRDMVHGQISSNAKHYPSGGDYTISVSLLICLLNDAGRCALLEDEFKEEIAANEERDGRYGRGCQ